MPKHPHKMQESCVWTGNSSRWLFHAVSVQVVAEKGENNQESQNISLTISSGKLHMWRMHMVPLGSFEADEHPFTLGSVWCSTELQWPSVLAEVTTGDWGCNEMKVPNTPTLNCFELCKAPWFSPSFKVFTNLLNSFPHLPGEGC